MKFKKDGYWHRTDGRGRKEVYVPVMGSLYHCDIDTDKIYELDTTTKLELSQASSPSALPMGIGGISGKLYHCDYSSKKIYELDASTKLELSQASSPSYDPYGIGGIK